MIEFLKISSMAVFDEVAIEFTEGLNCITGETGAGKSLIIEALTLLMGARASSNLVRPGASKAIIEALFTLSGEEQVIRREISSNGRSRCFINGDLATSDKLAEFSAGLIHIYGQHQYQDLLVPKEHMRIMEELAKLDRAKLSAAFDDFRKAFKNVQEIKERIAQTAQDMDNLMFSLRELRAAAVQAEEENCIASELDIARSALELKENTLEVHTILYEDNLSIIDRIAAAQNILVRTSAYDARLQPHVESLDAISAQIEDIAQSLRVLAEGYEYDPERIESLETRLYLIRDLKRKYAKDEKGLITLQNDLENRCGLIDDSTAAIEEAMHKAKAACGVYLAEISKFLKKRTEFAQKFSTRINAILADLGMPGTHFTVQQMDLHELESLNDDAVPEDVSPARLLNGEFMISTNVGLHIQPLTKIASGGELSRIMLALKVQEKAHQDASLIFDEIDTGISGETALKMAEKLKSIAAHAQTIIITHLPQVAAMASSHQVISKSVQEDKTVSNIRSVDGKQRVLELARMMGGENPSQHAIKHAQELIQLQIPT